MDNLPPKRRTRVDGVLALPLKAPGTPKPSSTWERKIQEDLRRTQATNARPVETWKHGAAFYAQITVEDAITGKKVVRRVRLEDADKSPVLTVAEAGKAMRILQVGRERRSSAITGQQVADYIKLMCYSGGRASETLRLRWSDVDFANGQVCFGADGLAKNHRSRAVDFNPALKAHLGDMRQRRQPDSVLPLQPGVAPRKKTSVPRPRTSAP